MSESQASSTELTSQYIAQITGDLERNTKEQERIGAVEAIMRKTVDEHYAGEQLVTVRRRAVERRV
ncbi:hypothetical protein ACWD4T_50215, partial [Streptomyces umbrinus]